MRTGDAHERTLIREVALTPAEGVLDQGWRCEISVNTDGEKTVLDEGKALARWGSHLGAHTLPWRVTARQRTSAAPGVGRDLAGNYRQDPGREQPRLELDQGPTASTVEGTWYSTSAVVISRSLGNGTDGSKYMISAGLGECWKMPRLCPTS
jgi:hypothetical protein